MTCSISSALSGIIVQWNRETGEEVRRFLGHDGGTWAIDVSSDGRYVRELTCAEWEQ